MEKKPFERSSEERRNEFLMKRNDLYEKGMKERERQTATERDSDRDRDRELNPSSMIRMGIRPRWENHGSKKVKNGQKKSRKEDRRRTEDGQNAW